MKMIFYTVTSLSCRALRITSAFSIPVLGAIPVDDTRDDDDGRIGSESGNDLRAKMEDCADKLSVHSMLKGCRDAK